MGVLNGTQMRLAPPVSQCVLEMIQKRATVANAKLYYLGKLCHSSYTSEQEVIHGL